MKRAMNLWVIGGDMRQVKLAQLLEEDGHSVHTYGLERAPERGAVERAGRLEDAALADCVILPLPVWGEGSMLNAPMSASSHPLTQVLEALRPGQVVCGGMISPQTEALAASYGLTLRDYFRREELAVANAVPGALAV